MASDLRITKLSLMNYRSIRWGELDIVSPLALIGPNGSGKSNVIDAFAFLANCMNKNLRGAVKEAGEINALIHRNGSGRSGSFGVRVEMRSESRPGTKAFCALEVEQANGDGFGIAREVCWVTPGIDGHSSVLVGSGRIATTMGLDSGVGLAAATSETLHGLRGAFPDEAGSRENLALPLNSSMPAIYPAGTPYVFAEVVRLLRTARIHSPNPELIKPPCNRDDGQELARNSANASSVLLALQSRDPAAKATIVDILRAIVPGLTGVEARLLGDAYCQTFFTIRNGGGSKAREFSAESVSDGTVRALAILLALHQHPKPSLVAIEEPENCVHPGASHILLETFQSFSRDFPVVFSTHSPDILDSKDLKPENFCVVTSGSQGTLLSRLPGPVRQGLAGQRISIGEVMRESLYADDSGAAAEPPPVPQTDEECRARLFGDMA